MVKWFVKIRIGSFRIRCWIRWARWCEIKTNLVSIVWYSQLIDIGAFVGMPLLNFERLNEFLYDLSSQYILVLSYEQEWNRIAIFKWICSLNAFCFLQQSAGKSVQPVQRNFDHLHFIQPMTSHLSSKQSLFITSIMERQLLHQKISVMKT